MQGVIQPAHRRLLPEAQGGESLRADGRRSNAIGRDKDIGGDDGGQGVHPFAIRQHKALRIGLNAAHNHAGAQPISHNLTENDRRFIFEMRDAGRGGRRPIGKRFGRGGRQLPVGSGDGVAVGINGRVTQGRVQRLNCFGSAIMFSSFGFGMNVG